MEISLAYSARRGLAKSVRNSSINRTERKLVKTNLPGIDSIVLRRSTAPSVGIEREGGREGKARVATKGDRDQVKNHPRTSGKLRRETSTERLESPWEGRRERTKEEARNFPRRSRTQVRWSGRLNLTLDHINAVNRREEGTGGDLIKNFRQFVRSILQAARNWRVHRRKRANGLKSGTRGREGSVSDRSVCLIRGLCRDGWNG